MRNSPFFVALTSSLLLSLATLASAQKIIVVDANGAGDFKDLPAALAAAKDGDRLLVRKGVYSPGKTDKALKIIGQAGAVIRTSQSLPKFEVHGLAQGKTFVMQGMSFDVAAWTVFGSLPAPLEILDCKGLVHLEGLMTSLRQIAVTYSIEIGDSNAVTLADCTLEPGLHVYRTHVVATGCQFLGLDGPPYRTTSGSFGVDAHTATVELAQVVARGGAGSGHAPSFSAVRANSSTLIVRGDAKSRYEGGAHSAAPSAALYGFGNSTLVLDPSVTLIRGYQAFMKVTSKRMASLRGKGAPIAGHTSLELFAEQGNGYGLFAALPMQPLQIPGLGESWLDGTTLLFIGSGVMNATEHAMFATFVPKNEAFIGLPVAFQAIQINAKTGFTMSNPTVVVLR